jgi:DNA-binding NtrC family response regulator
VAATNRDLLAEIDTGRFRQDLYYRLSVVTVEIPPLRERRDDIPLLVERFRDVFTKEHDKAVTGVTPGALAALVGYAWPGNVRELKNVVESAVLFAAGPRIDLGDLPAAVRGRASAPAAAPARTASNEGPAVRAAVPTSPETLPEAPAQEESASVATLVGKTMAEIEREAILTALQVTGGNRRRAAESLGIGLRTLQRKLKEYQGEAVGEDDEDDGDEAGD